MALLYAFVFFLLGNHFISYQAEGLRAQKIIGGQLAEAGQFKYIVAIVYDVGGPVFTPEIQCTGSIISDWHIITTAQCFHEENMGLYRNREFFIGVSVIDIYNPLSTTRYIRVDFLYLPSFYNPFNLNTQFALANLAIVKLALNLGLRQGHRYLRKLRIARDSYILPEHLVPIAGYGWNQIQVLINLENGIANNIILGETDGKLRFADIEIVNRSECRHIVGQLLPIGHICAKIIQEVNERKGICEGDSGIPIVRNNNYLIGIAVKPWPECNDNQKPGIYIDIPYHHYFINSVLQNNFNRVRILRLVTINSTIQFVPI